MKKFKTLVCGGVLAMVPLIGLAHEGEDHGVVDICPNAASRAAIHSILKSLLTDARNEENGGFGFDMWGAVVNRDGVVCAVAYSGEDRGDQWPGSRIIAAQKANTANAFSLPGFALSTANLWEATQPGGSLFGLQASNPINTDVAYAGPSENYGADNDPMVGHKIGGVNVFGGGLALYNADGVLLGGLGVSGDSSCADHNIAWRVRMAAHLDFVPAGPHDSGVSEENTSDQIIYVGAVGSSAPGFAHPDCGHGEKAVSEAFPPVPDVPVIF